LQCRPRRRPGVHRRDRDAPDSHGRPRVHNRLRDASAHQP
jgi:hypothetical protein